MADMDILGGAPRPAPTQSTNSDLITDTTTTTFVTDVIEASRDALVLVDFWAPWCGPCKQLTPVLEKIVKAAGGTVKLAKMDIDQNPEIPGQMGIQSIPAVFAFKGGRPVDGFTGALPESEIKKFIEKHAGADALAGGTADLDTANAAFEAGDFQGAGGIFSMILSKDPENADATGGLAKCLVKAGEFDQAAEILAAVPADKQSLAAVSAAQAMLDLARRSQSTQDTGPLLARIEQDPNDHQTRYDLALALGAVEDRAGAVDHLLEVIARKRDWNDEAARLQLVQFFEAWGPGEPATVEGRRRLSSILFS